MEALYLPVEARVVRRLADLALVYASGESTVDVPLRQEELASLAGSTRSTTNRVLQQLVDDNVVALARGRIVDPRRQSTGRSGPLTSTVAVCPPARGGRVGGD